MYQPLMGKMEDSFTTKMTTTDKGPVSNIKMEVKSLFGEVFNLGCRWNSSIVSSQEEEETVYVQRSSVTGSIEFPRGSILRYDENSRSLTFEVPHMDFNKDKSKLATEVTDDFLRY